MPPPFRHSKKLKRETQFLFSQRIFAGLNYLMFNSVTQSDIKTNIADPWSSSMKKNPPTKAFQLSDTSQKTIS